MRLVINVDAIQKRGFKGFAINCAKKYDGGNSLHKKLIYKIINLLLPDTVKNVVELHLDKKLLRFNFTVCGERQSLDSTIDIEDLSEQGKEFKFIMNFQRHDVDNIIRFILDSDVVKNPMAKSILETVNTASSGYAKYELISRLCDWGSNNNIFNAQLERIKEDSIKNKTDNKPTIWEKLDIKLGRITFYSNIN